MNAPAKLHEKPLPDRVIERWNRDQTLPEEVRRMNSDTIQELRDALPEEFLELGRALREIQF